MAIERSPILPRRVYWVDVPGEPDSKARELFAEWLDEYRGKVRVIATNDYDERAWYQFEVIGDGVKWRGPGLPTISSIGETEDDTVQRPPPETSPLDDLDKTVKTAGAVILGSAVLIGGLVVYSMLPKRR